MRLCYIFLLIFFSTLSFGQKTDTIYFKLEKGKYSLNKTERAVSIRTKHWSTLYTVFIPCTCKKGGGIVFYSHNNPEVGDIQAIEPVKTISKKQLSVVRFINFESLVSLMKENDVIFNRLFTLYFVEADTRKVYHVLKATNFADDYNDLLPTDTTGMKE